MTTRDELPNRQSTRLPGWDYAWAGAYFITFCTKHQRQILGEVRERVVCLSIEEGMVWQVWYGLPDHYPHVLIDCFVVMPNHVHGIIVLTEDSAVRAGLRPAPTGAPVWHRGSYDRIIRNERELDAVRIYIHHNPTNWANDRFNAAQKERL